MTIDHRVQLADIQRPIALFAQGLAGRYLHLKPVAADARARAVERTRAVTEGDTIELPVSIADFESSTYNVGAYRIAVLRQIGYLTDGTVDFSLGVARGLMPIPMSLVRVSPTASELESFLAHWSRPALLQRVFQTLEAFRIDGLIRRRYPGARADLDRVRGKALAGRPPLDELSPLGAAIEALLQYTLGGARSPKTCEFARLADSVQAEGADVYGSARAAITICTLLDARFCLRSVSGTQPAVPIEAGSGSDYIPPPDELGGLGLDFPGEPLPEAVSGPRRGGQVGNLQSIGTTILTSGSPHAQDAQHRQPGVMNSPRASSRARASADHDVRSYLYDEWDYHTHSYLRAWCRLYEQKLRGDNFAFIDDVHRRHALLAQQVRRQFGFIRPELWHRVRRTNDGDELELDAVIEAVIDRRSSGASDSQLYIRRDRALRDVAAAFLVDMSASTGFPLPDPQPAQKSVPVTEGGPYLYGGVADLPKPAREAKRRVIDVAKDALALMCEALQRLGDRCAIYGFSGDGRERVEFHIAKNFADKLSLQTWAALGAMEPLRSTRMGPAIRHAVSKLLRQTANMRILIIVSDGYPQDHDYGPDRRDQNYGIEDTACALREAECAGVLAFCVTIDPAGHDYLRRMCADSHYMVIDDVMALPRELTKIYRKLTA